MRDRDLFQEAENDGRNRAKDVLRNIYGYDFKDTDLVKEYDLYDLRNKVIIETKHRRCGSNEYPDWLLSAAKCEYLVNKSKEFPEWNIYYMNTYDDGSWRIWDINSSKVRKNVSHRKNTVRDSKMITERGYYFSSSDCLMSGGTVYECVRRMV